MPDQAAHPRKAESATRPPGSRTLVSSFAEAARDFADRTALVEGDRVTTYAELDRRSARVAALLRERWGVGRGDPVGVHMARSTDLYVLMLGILRAGACVVPLNPEHPAKFVDRVVAESGTRVVLHDGDRAFGDAVRVAPIRELTGGKDLPDVEPSEVDITGESTAFLMFTSGSTGRPKGVRIAHRGLARLGPDQGRLAVTERDVLAQFAAYSFAASTIEIWLSLLHGATLVVLPPGLPTLRVLRDAVLDNGVTVLSLPGGLFNLVVDEEPEVLAGLRAVVLSGDFPSHGHLTRAAGLTSGTVYNGYGCTENSSISLLYPIDSVDDVSRHDRVPVGKPMPGVVARVLDEDLRPCPPGEVGQLCIGGTGVALGYLDQPELTAEKFVPGPDGEVLYRTGDLARLTDDGDVVLVGRADSMVKVRGYRVETSEVELALRDHPSVRQAVVKSFGDENKELVAFYSTVDGSPLDPDQVVGHLSDRVPAYAVPSLFDHRDSLPHNVNGKIDRSALAVPAAHATTTKGDETMNDAKTLLEPVILQAWKDISSLQDFEVTDSFLGHGGNSLHFVQLANRLQKIFAVEVETEDVFRHGTVEKLAAHIDGIRDPRTASH
ncbi:amino acid adenylation domain-containing protein [Umezawaea endophytica]|uniref:Non-ribosomal peptide synthetase n=1 Tax=Umezawaea endophytica TaxID=1654476 RepID=A0A9X2VHZ9_9PSEU|nr:non-ribosomal peptide synthetase [Umezawaea endophytica]MCS7476734.1 non-ribosomal peptide synthetase [Umezawaea endophytica]